jgi:hypothetical protein
MDYTEAYLKFIESYDRNNPITSYKAKRKYLKLSYEKSNNPEEKKVIEKLL